MDKYDLDTPCLIVDLDAMENNIKDMAAIAKENGVNLRPMIKSHKVPAIAHLQLDAGAVGINAAKLGEAEVMAASGIKDIFITNEIIGSSKLERLVNLAKRCKITASVDSLEVAKGLSEAAENAGIELKVRIQVDTGNRRNGILPGEPTVKLAHQIWKLKALIFKGIWTHEGQLALANNYDDRKKMQLKAGEDLLSTAKMLKKEGIPCEEISSGSTAGAKIAAKIDGITEIRPGAYVVYDIAQLNRRACRTKDLALSVLTTVFSKPAVDRVVSDVGSKGIFPPGDYCSYSIDEDPKWKRSDGKPACIGLVREPGGRIREDIVLNRLGEEYGIFKLSNPEKNVKIGDRLEIIPYHCCPTVNLYDELIGLRNGKVEVTWPILARGKMS